MCCSGKRDTCVRRSRRTPIVVTLGYIAYQKYQQYQAQKRIQPTPDSASEYLPRSSLSPSDDHFDSINAEILKGAGIEPPSYDAVMEKQGAPPALRLKRADSLSSVASGSSSASWSSTEDVVYTPRAAVADTAEVRAKVQGGGEQRWASKRDMKKAQRAARKAEKWTVKAKERGWVSES